MLRSLRVRGFKSFADPVDLAFGPGVNVIVGPNGSGKSNVAEAILWAMGEQRAGRLRAPGMQDVIFSGGPGRAAAGLCEVTLTLAAEAAAGAQPAEAEVARRLTRAGEAAYRLNGSSCRLLDVHDALSVRGLGPRSLSVIRQGQVEAICTSHPVERRAIIDEAAGVGLPKRRRHRAGQRLARVAERLDRAREQADEIAARARALERQARAAERAAALDAEIVAVRDSLARARALQAARGLALARAARDAAAAAASAASARVDEARAVWRAASDEASRLSARLAEAERAASALGAAVDRLAGRAETAADRVAAVMDAARREEASRAALASELSALEAGSAAAAAALTEARDERDRAEAALAAAERHDRTAAEGARSARELADSTARDLAAARREAEGLAAALARALADQARLEERLAEAGAGPEIDLVRAERRGEISAARVEAWRARSRAAAAARDDAHAAVSAAEERLRECRKEAARLAPPPGESPAAAGTIGDGLEVEPGMERAVAAALGDLADAPLVPGVEAGIGAIEAGAPAAAVAPPGSGHDGGRAPLPGARSLSGVVVACPDEARAHVDRLLADVWLVTDLDAAAATTTNGSLLVTREGLALRPALGVLRAAHGGWARRALHRRAAAAEAAASASLQQARHDQAAAVAAAARADRRLRAADRAAARAAASLASGRAEAQRRSAAQAEAGAALAGARGEAGRAQEALAVARAAVEARERLVEHAAADAAAASAAAEAGAEARRVARGAMEQAVARASQAEAATADLGVRLARARAAADRPAGAPDLSVAHRAARALAAAAAALTPHRDRALADAAAGRSEAAVAARAVAAAEAAVTQAEGRTQEVADRLHAADVALAVAAERADAAGDPGPDHAASDAAPPDPGVLAEQLAALERRRLSLGAVNPLAAAEREDLTGRETEIREQVEDLEASAAGLHAHMSELDDAVADGFREALEAVGRRFSEVVGLLFPGGEGRLRAVEVDGEQGVEVEVVPAGKRPRAMSLLSGGERSLVALAFCLGLAMARPAPFYLLDEVEAALDDVNLRRFLGVVRRLSSETQFLLITHQQPTVEMADTLFGVTMGRDGVSQVVGRRLARDLAGPARPYVRRRLSVVGE